MKCIFFFLLAFGILGCNEQTDKSKDLQNRVDSLEIKLAETYKPGFGEFMSDIQVHHNKLWFAGENENWKLADFEINEIKEGLDNIKKYCKDRPETNSIGMIEQPLQNLSSSIQQKKLPEFNNNYAVLTNMCNNCHQTTQHGYNIIKIPTTPPYSNQVFKPANGK